MKLKNRIIFRTTIVIVAIAALIYNLSIHNKIAYMASIIAVIGTVIYLALDIIKLIKER